MKRLLFYLTLTLLSTTVLTQAQENKLGVTLDVTYLSSYLDKGFDTYGPGGHSGIQSSINLDLYSTNFGINITQFKANSSGFENDEMIDYTIYYENTLFQNEIYATDYKINWIYHQFPDQPRNISNTQEIEAGFSWPDIFPIDLAPSYTVCREWPTGRNYDNHDAGGWAHVFGLGYNLVVPSFVPDTKEQLLYLSADIIYNDGLGGPNIDHDWSHMLFGISTELEITGNLSFTPGFYYQSSWEDSVNSQDEFWTSLSMTYKF